MQLCGLAAFHPIQLGLMGIFRYFYCHCVYMLLYLFLFFVCFFVLFAFVLINGKKNKKITKNVYSPLYAHALPVIRINCARTGCAHVITRSFYIPLSTL